jgi:glutamate-1-semialdehyde 2,1-aminomutase
MAQAAIHGANTFLDPDSKTARLYDEASRIIPGGTSRLHYFFQPYPIYAQSAKGAVVTDVEGVERLDFLNNMTALIHGHANPAINQAVIEQVERGLSFSEPAPNEVELARIFVERVPSVEQIRFFNSGTESVMMALKLARALTGRSRIAKFEGFYHGYYDFVQVSFASHPDNWGAADEPRSTPSSGGLSEAVTPDVLTLPYNDQDGVERLLERHGASLAALIMDPLPARSAFPLPSREFLEFVRDITRAYGIPLIFDEVISFRLGYAGAQGKYGVAPDLTAFGKIIGGGLPIGAVGGRRELMSLLDPSQGQMKVISGGTFSANPMSMAAGHAAMQQLTPETFVRLDALGERLRSSATVIMRDAGLRGQLSGDGSLFAILFSDAPVTDYRASYQDADANSKLAQLHLHLLDEGIIMANKSLGCLSTPMGEAEVDAFLAAFERAVARLTEEA